MTPSDYLFEGVQLAVANSLDLVHRAEAAFAKFLQGHKISESGHKKKT